MIFVAVCFAALAIVVYGLLSYHLLTRNVPQDYNIREEDAPWQ